MVERTSTTIAPWTLVEGNDKGIARIKILSTVCAALAAGIARAEAAGAKALARNRLEKSA